MNKIVLLVDFTGVSLLAMEHVALLAKESLCRVILLHIASPDKSSDVKAAEKEVREFAQPLDKEGVPYAVVVKFGDFFSLISDEMKTIAPDLLVVGTHGFKGIKKNFESSNILNLLRKIDVPSLVIQGHASPPYHGYKSILVPLIESNETIEWHNLLGSFASVFLSEVRLLAYYNNTNKDKIANNSEAVRKTLTETEGISCIVDMEETSLYTAAYSRSIIEYSDIEDSDAIVLFLGKKEDDYFSLEDQENILLNRLGKPILVFK